MTSEEGQPGLQLAAASTPLGGRAVANPSIELLLDRAQHIHSSKAHAGVQLRAAGRAAK